MSPISFLNSTYELLDLLGVKQQFGICPKTGQLVNSALDSVMVIDLLLIALAPVPALQE